MVVGAVAISLLPVLFMFFVSYSLLNRTLARWFPRPIEIAADQSRALQQEMLQAERDRLARLAEAWARDSSTNQPLSQETIRVRCDAADAHWRVTSSGVVENLVYCTGPAKTPDARVPAPVMVAKLASGAEVWTSSGALFLASHSTPSEQGITYAARLVPADF